MVRPEQGERHHEKCIDGGCNHAADGRIGDRACHAAIRRGASLWRAQSRRHDWRRGRREQPHLGWPQWRPWRWSWWRPRWWSWRGPFGGGGGRALGGCFCRGGGGRAAAITAAAILPMAVDEVTAAAAEPMRTIGTTAVADTTRARATGTIRPVT